MVEIYVDDRNLESRFFEWKDCWPLFGPVNLVYKFSKLPEEERSFEKCLYTELINLANISGGFATLGYFLNS